MAKLKFPSLVELELWKKCDTIPLLFFTSHTNTPTNTDIPNDLTEGVRSVLELMGDVGAPPPSRLRCYTTQKPLLNYDALFLVSANFRAIDVTLTGSPDQNSVTLTEIENSLTSNNDAYMQSRFRFAEIGGWIPNGFRPSIVTNSVGEVLPSFRQPQYAEINEGDMSMGFLLPYALEPATPLYLGKMESESEEFITVNASAWQYVAGERQPYPILCEMEILGVKR